MKAVLFDFGGTLDTDGVHWSEMCWEYYRRYHIDVPKPAYEKAFVASDLGLMDDPGVTRCTFHETLRKQFFLQFSILGINSRGSDVARMADDCYADVQQTIAKAKSILKALKPNYALGIVSNFYGNLNIVCKEFGLDELFEAMIDSRVVGIKKPDPAIFTIALKKLGVRAVDAFVVGDSYERDIVPGKSLGCRTIWLKGKSWKVAPATEAADYSIERFEDIRNILVETGIQNEINR